MIIPVQNQTQEPPEVIETIQTFEIQLFANPTAIILAAHLPRTHRVIQLPFDRLAFRKLMLEAERALERVPESDGEGFIDVPEAG